MISRPTAASTSISVAETCVVGRTLTLGVRIAGDRMRRCKRPYQGGWKSMNRNAFVNGTTTA
jgi:hypothetical protein